MAGHFQMCKSDDLDVVHVYSTSTGYQLHFSKYSFTRAGHVLSQNIPTHKRAERFSDSSCFRDRG